MSTFSRASLWIILYLWQAGFDRTVLVLHQKVLAEFYTTPTAEGKKKYPNMSPKQESKHLVRNYGFLNMNGSLVLRGSSDRIPGVMQRRLQRPSRILG